MDDKTALKTSNAGMRLIAQQTLYNRGDLARLREFVSESYTEAALDLQQVDARLAAFEAALDEAGKLRVHQVLATSKHQIVVLMVAEKSGGFYLNELKVEEDYPHRITHYSHHAMDGQTV